MKSGPYSGKVDIGWDEENDELTVTIDTERLRLSAVTEKQAVPYHQYLFGDAEVTKSFRDGNTYSFDAVVSIVKEWEERWERKYPFSAFVVEEKDVDKFTGHVALKDGNEIGGSGGEPGEAEFSYLFAKEQWNKGFGKEAVKGVLTYAYDLAQKKCKVNDKPFDTLIATARVDNPGSVKILEGIGMACAETKEKHGALRNHYRMSLTPPK